MLWALIIITCGDWNNCVMSKKYFNSQGECIAEQNFIRPRLENLKLKPTAICVQQEETTYDNG